MKKLLHWAPVILILLGLTARAPAPGYAQEHSQAGEEFASGPSNPEAIQASGHSGVGPDDFPPGANPLTGEIAGDVDLLKLPPAMISITNFPVSARPQAGLSFSPYVFELYIGEGTTRFLALFYGSYPSASSNNQGASGFEPTDAAIGPVRSGRLPYESLRNLYNGFLVMAGASADVGARLNASTTVYGSDSDDINSALIAVTRLERIARANQKAQTRELNLTANRFEEAVPAGGEQAKEAWVFYNYLNQINWVYDRATGAYLRFQDKADGSGKFHPSTDRLTGKQLAFENVVVLFADHQALTRTIIDIDLMYTIRPALLFRDGKVYRIFWSTLNGEYEKKTGRLRPIRFVDAKGKPFPLKPGQTWVEIVTSNTTVQEIADSEWKVRFYAPQRSILRKSFPGFRFFFNQMLGQEDIREFHE